MGSCVGSSGLNLLGSKSAKGPWGGGYKEGGTNQSGCGCMAAHPPQ